MKRVLLCLFSAVVVSLIGVSAGAQSGANNIRIPSYEIDYQLSKDESGRSLLGVKETIFAEFIRDGESRGIERYIPKDYDGRKVGLTIVSVTDESGNAYKYTTYDSGEYTVLRVGDKDTYLTGQKTYIINYTQRDVTKSFADNSSDEWHWDTNGTEWSAEIDRLAINFSIDENLVKSMNGNMRCYQGSFRSSDQCKIAEEGSGYSVVVTDLKPRQNVTLAVGFDKGTFAEYQPSLFEKILAIWMVVQGILIAVSTGIIVFLIVRYVRWSRRSSEVGTIIPEYIPPKDASVSVSSAVVSVAHSVVTAQLIDLAVRHYIKLYEVKPKTMFSLAVYEIEIVKDTSDLRAEELEVLHDIFQTASIGGKISTETMRKDTTLATRLMDNTHKTHKLMQDEYGVKQKDAKKSKWFKTFGLVLIGLSVPLLGLPLLVAGVVSISLGYTLRVFTDKGLELYRYLKGLEMYIGVAETERIKMLQSPDGAAKTQIDANDTRQLVKLYERVLPYAVLFGQEKEWNKQLGQYYTSADSQPEWFVGASLASFNAAAFSSTMSQLTTSIDSSGASYSSSSGSSGGGFSGSGGGGGGGGSW